MFKGGVSELSRNVRIYRPMGNSKPTRQGPLTPQASKDAVVVEDPSHDPIIMTADEADLSAIRMLEEAAKARENHDRGERSE